MGSCNQAVPDFLAIRKPWCFVTVRNCVTLQELGPFGRGRDNVVGIATRYLLDGPRIESRWRQDFPHLTRPALGPTPPPVQWVPGLSRG
jgi:hypothetical protein